MSESEEYRVQREKKLYNKGLNRKEYNSKLGYAKFGTGYAEKRKDETVANALKEGKGKRVLELGSTSWKQYIDFEKYAPSELVCINISEKELEKGIKASKKFDTNKYCKHSFKVMDAHKLEFPDKYFDIVFGTGILHHLNFETAIREIARVLKKGGKIVFSEPLARNPVAKLVRKLTPDARTPDERPLDKLEMTMLSGLFELDSSYYQLFYVPVAIISSHVYKSPDNPLTYFADKVDLLIEKIFKRTNLCLYFRIIVIKGKKVDK